MPHFPSKNDMVRPIPTALDKIQAYCDLAATEKTIIRTRLLRISQICIDALEELRHDGGKLRFVLDGLELDVISTLGTNQNPRVSTWIIDSVWSADFSPLVLCGAMGHELRSIVSENLPSLDAEQEEVKEWLSQQCTSVLKAIDDFFGAASPEQAISTLIGVHLIFSRIAVLAMMTRLNENLI